MNREKAIANLSAEVNRLMNQNIRLEEERAEIWRRNRDTESSRDTKAAIIAELKAENESLRKDAARYRLMRELKLKQLDEKPDEFDAEFDRQTNRSPENHS